MRQYSSDFKSFVQFAKIEYTDFHLVIYLRLYAFF